MATDPEPGPYDGWQCPVTIPGAAGWMCTACGRASGTYLERATDGN